MTQSYNVGGKENPTLGGVSLQGIEGVVYTKGVEGLMLSKTFET